MALIGDDCHWFYTALCRKGVNCQYRHCEEALGSDVVCPSWLEGGCYLPHCPYRHAHVQGASQPWNEFSGYGVPQTVQPVRSSLVAVPIVGGIEPVPSRVPSRVPSTVQYALPSDDQYYDDGFDQPYDDPYVEHGPGPAAVIITPRHDELFPPQVKPVVVRIGSNEDSSESEDSEVGRGNLTTIRRIDTSDMVMENESPRVVVEKEKIEAADDATPPERQAVNREKMDAAAEKEGEDTSSEEEDEQEGSVVSGGEEDEEEGEASSTEKTGSEKNGSEGSDTSSEEESEASSGSGPPAPPVQEQVEPELDLFDDDDTAILGVVEQTPIRNRQAKEARRASKDERRQEKRDRREDRRRSRSPFGARPDRRERPARPARPVVRRKNEKVERKTSPPEKSATDEKKEPVEVMSLEDIMRQKALQSMIERRKLKEQAEKTKQGGTEAAEVQPRSFTPDPARKDSPKRPDSRTTAERRWSPGRDRPPLRGPRSPPRRWSPPPQTLSSSDRTDRTDSRWRPSRFRRGDYPPPGADLYPPPPPYNDRWRRYDDDLVGDLRPSPADRNISLLHAQTSLMDQMSRLASGPSQQLLSEKDLKRQQKLLKKQLKQLSKAIDTRSGSESRSSSLCTTCSDSSSTDSRRHKRRKHKAKKLKRKKAKKSRRKSPEKAEENETENGMEDDYVEYDESPRRTPTPVASPTTSDEVELEPPKVLPRAKVVIKLDGDSKSMNISGSDLLQQVEVAKEEEVKVVQGRKIQLKKGKTPDDEGEEVTKVRGAIAGRVAAKKADDEATKLMLQKIRESARNETRKVVMSGSTTSAVSKSVRSENAKVSPLLSKAVTVPGRLVQVTGKKPVSERLTVLADDVRPSLEADASKRRIIRRVPAPVYVPPSANRKATGDSLDSNDARSQLEKRREEAKTQRSLTPEPASSTNGSDSNSTAAARRATVADIRTNAPTPPAEQLSTSAKNFELGVKTFAEIMREKKERKARELGEKRRLAEGGGTTGPASSKPKLTRPSVLERLSLPKESTTNRKPSEPAPPPPTGTRTIQKYEDDWLDEPAVEKSVPLTEGLIRENKRRQELPTNRSECLKAMKRARTEPTRKLLSSKKDSKPIKSRSEEVVQAKFEPRTNKPTNTVRPQRTAEELEEDLLLMDDSDDSEPQLVEAPVPEPRIPQPAPQANQAKSAPVVKEDTAKIPERSSSARKSDSHSELEEMERLLGDVGQSHDARPSPHNDGDGDDDDDNLLFELDQLLA